MEDTAVATAGGMVDMVDTGVMGAAMAVMEDTVDTDTAVKRYLPPN